MRKVIEMTLDLMNEREKNVTRITIMMYDLIEKNVLANEKSIEKSFASNFEASINEKSIEKLFVKKLIDQSNIIQQILKTYSLDDVFQRVMKVKRFDYQKILIDLIRKKLKLKLKNCEIKENLLWVKNRIYVLEKKSFYANIMKQTHESLLENHTNRDAIYDKVNRHYYWFKMINIVAQYIKVCHACKRTKIYRDDKHELLKFLSISKRYFQNISMNFIISLLVCKRYHKTYEHIMIVVNKLFKKRRFMTLNSFSVNIVVQVFVKWIWKEKNYSSTIVFDRDIQFISHFWRHLYERINTTFKLSTTWHSKTNDQTINANENLKAYLRELQSKRLSKLFTHDWIRNQFHQEQLYKNWIVSCNKKIFTQVKHRVFYLYYCKSNDSKKNEKCRQINREARDFKNLFSRKVKMNSRQNEKTSQSRSTLNIEVSSQWHDYIECSLSKNHTSQRESKLQELELF